MPAPQVRGVRAVHSSRRRPAVPLPGLREWCATARVPDACARERLVPFRPCSAEVVCAHSHGSISMSQRRGALNCAAGCLPRARADGAGVAAAAAYCEDHLPHDADILQICPRFQYLGQLHPRPVRAPARPRMPPLLVKPRARICMCPPLRHRRQLVCGADAKRSPCHLNWPQSAGIACVSPSPGRR